MKVATVTLKSTASYKYSPISPHPPSPNVEVGGTLTRWGKERGHSRTKFVGHEAFSELWNDLAVTECPGFLKHLVTSFLANN